MGGAMEFTPHEIPAVRAGKLTKLAQRVEAGRAETGALAHRVTALEDEPAPAGEGGAPIDPGDLTVYFDNGLI